MQLTSGRRGGRGSEKAGARDMAMAMDASPRVEVFFVQAGRVERQSLRDGPGWFIHTPNKVIGPLKTEQEAKSRAVEEETKLKPGGSERVGGKDEYRDEDLEQQELARGKQEDHDATQIERHGRWGSRATDKAGARDASLTLEEARKRQEHYEQAYMDGKITKHELSAFLEAIGRLVAKDFAMNPLTSKGEEIMSNMKDQYGAEKGKEVFYASANKGTIKGVHDEAQDSANYRDVVDLAKEFGAERGAQELANAISEANRYA